jgi:hypothetical protein
MVDNSTSPCEGLSGWIFVIGQTWQVTSSRVEAPSEFFCWRLHQLPRNMTQQPHLLRWLSSGNRWQGVREHLARRPSSVGSAGCHRWCPLPIALRQTLAITFSRLHKRHPQRGMGTYKMVVGAPPLEMGQQVWRLLCCGPGPAGQSCHPMADGQIHPFDESGVLPLDMVDNSICPCEHIAG